MRFAARFHIKYFLLSFTLCTLLGLALADRSDSATTSNNKKAARKTVFKKVAPGDTVYGILKKIGFDRESTNAALAKNILPSNFALSPGDIFEVTRVENPREVHVRFYDAFKVQAYSFWKSSQRGAGAEKVKADLTARKFSARGKIVGSIVASIKAATGDDLLGYRFMDAFVVDYNLRKKVQRNAKFALTYEKLYAGKQFIRFGQILSAELEIDGKLIRRQFVPTPDGGIFADAKDLQTDRPLYAPVGQIRISSLFQRRRFHPVRKVTRAHLGIDFELPAGEKVYSSASGRVLRYGKNRGAGNFVVIRHDNGLETYYNHLRVLSKSLRKNQRIDAGKVIGEIGCTGLCTKPHLHFAVKKHGKYVDPIKYIRRYAFTQRKIASVHSEKMAAAN